MAGAYNSVFWINHGPLKSQCIIVPVTPSLAYCPIDPFSLDAEQIWASSN